MGFNHFLKTYYVFYVELWDILDGLILLKEQRLERNLIHTDNFEVAQALRTDTLTISTSALVRRIQKLLQHKKHRVIKHISKEANCIADKITRSVSTNKVEVNMLKTNCAFDIVGQI
ncbi:hypothetical protein PVK06_009956 [Gossypium arboreum]|uniref:RNase H type-1 domain-containing protein n=1 Tax=Gossypium arboreum TaxID=29729 RepID=A0ABR0QP11_GOSAR|nr:hypothetical protein PVK06_009956 [Gossypium arboreum]